MDTTPWTKFNRLEEGGGYIKDCEIVYNRILKGMEERK
jgi:hypothetical protein